MIKIYKKMIFFLGKINLKLSHYKNTKILAYLMFSTILIHIFAMYISTASDGIFWTYGERLIKQKHLFSIDLDGGYFEHYQYIVLLWCSLLSLLITIRQSRYTLSIFFIYLFLS